VGASLLGLDRNGQPGIVPAHLAGGITPPEVLRARPVRPHLHDRYGGIEAWRLVIPPVEPDLVAGTKWRAHWMARVWRRNMRLTGACLLGVERCSSGMRWLREQSAQGRFVLAQEGHDLVGHGALWGIVTQQLTVNGEPDVACLEIMEHLKGGHSTCLLRIERQFCVSCVSQSGCYC
jgi:hypothetical protein